LEKLMRKLIYGINLTLDGCCDHTKGMAGDDMHDFWMQLLNDSDTLLYGRVTYELMVPFWPDIAKSQSMPTQATNDFAKAFDAVENLVVFSRTLRTASDKTTIVRGNLKDEILKLKKQDGKDILTGGVDLPGQLIELDLVDEFIFVIQPIIVGEGRRLFDTMPLPEKLKLKLVESKTFESGFVAMRYVK